MSITSGDYEAGAASSMCEDCITYGVGDATYVATWTPNSYVVDVNPIINGTTYNSGLSGFTFDVYVNGSLVANDVIDWYTNVPYGSIVRVATNGASGYSTSYDYSITVPDNAVEFNPSWTPNSYAIDVNPIINGTTYNSGMSGFTFDVYVNGSLAANDVIDWYTNVPYGSTVRVITNNVSGYNSGFDQTISVPINGASINPTWTLADVTAPVCSLSISGQYIYANYSDDYSSAEQIAHGFDGSYNGATSYYIGDFTSSTTVYYYVADAAGNYNSCSYWVAVTPKVRECWTYATTRGTCQSWMNNQDCLGCANPGSGVSGNGSTYYFCTNDSNGGWQYLCSWQNGRACKQVSVFASDSECTKYTTYGGGWTNYNNTFCPSGYSEISTNYCAK